MSNEQISTQELIKTALSKASVEPLVALALALVAIAKELLRLNEQREQFGREMLDPDFIPF